MVVSEQGIVLGLLREKELAKRMRDRKAPTVLVTTPDARLVGLLYREEAERLAHKT